MEPMKESVRKGHEIKSYLVTIRMKRERWGVNPYEKHVIKAFNAEDAIAHAKFQFESGDWWHVMKIEPYSAICECGHEKKDHKLRTDGDHEYATFCNTPGTNYCGCNKNPNEVP